MYRRWPSAKMVSKANDDLPEPLSPVITVNRLRGMATLMFFRLCTLAPITSMLPSFVKYQILNLKSSINNGFCRLLLYLLLIFLILRIVLPCPLGRRSVASGHRERHACQHQGFDPHATYFVQPFSCHNSVLSVYEKPLRLQRYYKYLEYTRILRKKLNLFKVFEEKTWIFAQLCDRSFEGDPILM